MSPLRIWSTDQFSEVHKSNNLRFSMREASIWKKKKKVLWAVGKEGCFKAVEKRFFFQIWSKIHWWRNMIMRQKSEVFSILIVIITEMHKSCKTGIWKLSVYIFFLSNKEGDLGTNHHYIYKGNHRKDFHSRGEFWVNQNIFELELNREDECLFSLPMLRHGRGK